MNERDIVANRKKYKAYANSIHCTLAVQTVFSRQNLGSSCLRMDCKKKFDPFTRNEFVLWWLSLHFFWHVLHIKKKYQKCSSACDEVFWRYKGRIYELSNENWCGGYLEHNCISTITSLCSFSLSPSQFLTFLNTYFLTSDKREKICFLR